MILSDLRRVKCSVWCAIETVPAFRSQLDFSCSSGLIAVIAAYYANKSYGYLLCLSLVHSVAFRSRAGVFFESSAKTDSGARAPRAQHRSGMRGQGIAADHPPPPPLLPLALCFLPPPSILLEQGRRDSRAAEERSRAQRGGEWRGEKRRGARRTLGRDRSYALDHAASRCAGLARLPTLFPPARPPLLLPATPPPRCWSKSPRSAITTTRSMTSLSPSWRSICTRPGTDWLQREPIRKSDCGRSHSSSRNRPPPPSRRVKR